MKRSDMLLLLLPMLLMLLPLSLLITLLILALRLLLLELLELLCREMAARPVAGPAPGPPPPRAGARTPATAGPGVLAAGNILSFRPENDSNDSKISAEIPKE
jgi:hypothetical protein